MSLLACDREKASTASHPSGMSQQHTSYRSLDLQRPAKECDKPCTVSGCRLRCSKCPTSYSPSEFSISGEVCFVSRFIKQTLNVLMDGKVDNHDAYSHVKLMVVNIQCILQLGIYGDEVIKCVGGDGGGGMQSEDRPMKTPVQQ